MNKVITISREFGSGGRTIGRKVALKLGIKCYDQELIEEIAKQSGFIFSLYALFSFHTFFYRQALSKTIKSVFLNRSHAQWKLWLQF